jgi:hypothetical protein
MHWFERISGSGKVHTVQLRLNFDRFFDAILKKFNWLENIYISRSKKNDFAVPKWKRK